MTPGAEHERRLCVYSLSFLREHRIRRILELAGYRISTGWPRPRDLIGVWGQRPVSKRGRWVAARSGAQVVQLEDGFLRSVYPSGMGGPPLSLIIDEIGIYYDASRPSRLEKILQEDVLDDATLERALSGIEALRDARISKYSPPVARQIFGSGYVLLIDQTQGDASITGAGADARTFERMLNAARSENPGVRILIKSHPDVISGKRTGHFRPDMLRDDESLITKDVNPWDAIDGAKIVYSVSSQLGYEAILAGKPVRCFGQGFYAGWGLTEDDLKVPRRTARLTPETLFAGCHLTYPTYYDPWHDRLCDFETGVEVLRTLRDAEAQTISPNGEAFLGVRLWKRASIAAYRPRRIGSPRFVSSMGDASKIARSGRDVWAWASKVPSGALNDLEVGGGYVEDGFLRSVGLGAELTEASSLVFDRSGIYFDPTQPSDLESLIEKAAAGGSDRRRAAMLRQQIVTTGVTKYNVGSDHTSLPTDGRKVILVPGQVEDDASIIRGCGDIRTNLDLLRLAREAHPDGWIVYKPHPDVEAGLRAGAIDPRVAASFADEIADRTSTASLLRHADELWTLTSLMGLEALMREVPVTCLGTPFYAGWGLTQDLGPEVPRRTARPSLDDLVWAALIAYPSYIDPISGLPCTPELIVERLAAGTPHRKATMLSKLQSRFSGFHSVWR